MTPLNDKQLDKIRDKRREEIAAIALKSFAKNGYTGTKTSQIAMEAGISEGLIYRYYKTKKELFSTIIEALMTEAKRELEQLAYLPGTPYEQIRKLTESMMDKNSKYSFMLIQRVRKSDDVPEGILQSDDIVEEKAFIEILVPTFIKGQELGEFTEGEPRRLLSWYFSIINSIIMQDDGGNEYGLPDVDILMRILKK